MLTVVKLFLFVIDFLLFPFDFLLFPFETDFSDSFWKKHAK